MAEAEEHTENMPEQEYGPGMIRETEATDSTFCDL